MEEKRCVVSDNTKILILKQITTQGFNYSEGAALCLIMHRYLF